MTTTSTEIKIRYFNDLQIFNTETRSVDFFGDDIVSAVEHVMGKDLLGGIDLSANPLPASYTPATGIAVWFKYSQKNLRRRKINSTSSAKGKLKNKKSFTYLTCNYSSIFPSELRRRMRVHSNGRPYQCNYVQYCLQIA